MLTKSHKSGLNEIISLIFGCTNQPFETICLLHIPTAEVDVKKTFPLHAL